MYVQFMSCVCGVSTFTSGFYVISQRSSFQMSSQTISCLKVQILGLANINKGFWLKSCAIALWPCCCLFFFIFVFLKSRQIWNKYMQFKMTLKLFFKYLFEYFVIQHNLSTWDHSLKGAWSCITTFIPKWVF